MGNFVISHFCAVTVAFDHENLISSPFSTEQKESFARCLKTSKHFNVF